MTKYNIYKDNELIIQNATRKDLTEWNDGIMFDCAGYSRGGYRYKGIYDVIRIGADGKEIRVFKRVSRRGISKQGQAQPAKTKLKPEADYEKPRLTTQMIKEYCERFCIGDDVIVSKHEKGGNGEKSYTAKKKAKIIGKYPHMVLVEYRNGIRECFTYKEIVIFKAIIKA